MTATGREQTSLRLRSRRLRAGCTGALAGSSIPGALAQAIDGQGSRARSESQEDQSSDVQQIGFHARWSEYRTGHGVEADGVDGTESIAKVHRAKGDQQHDDHRDAGKRDEGPDEYREAGNQ